MLRRPIVVLAFAAVLASSGCATFDTDVVARVGDAELSRAELADRARALDLVADDRVSGDGARATIENWISLQLADKADIVGPYLEGPVESGISCLFALQTDDAASGDTLLARLRGGEMWSDLVAEVAPETPLDGRVDCFPTNSLEATAEQLETMSIDDPYRLLVFDDGPVVLVRMQNLDDLNGFELLNVALTVEPDSIDAVFAEVEVTDVFVSPRFGTFNKTTLAVQPVG